MQSLAASLWCTVLGSLARCETSQCPYCPDRPGRHWIKWGCYSRYAEGERERIEVQRYFCKFKGRTFSLLPDGLLPYQHERTATILRHLWAIFVKHEAVSTRARTEEVSRTTLSRHAELFGQTVAKLRLARQEGALGPAKFLSRLLRIGVERIAELFRAWKELEPKHSIVGIYPR
jgi:hypothetical protein